MSIALEFEAANLFGLSPFAARALTGHTAELGLIVPHTLDAIPRLNTDLFDPPRRRELAERLEAKLATLEPHVRVIDAVRRLAQPGATCILAGQQPGLFGGPLFNTFKALHVVRLARALEAQWQTPVIPMIWNHADDHDLAEVHHAWFANDQHNLVKVGLPGASSGRTPFSHLVCDDETHQLGNLRSRLADLHMGALDPAIAQLAVPRDGETLAAAWTRFHLELFGHLGLVVIEPDWIRQDLSNALADVIAPHPLACLRRASERLTHAGLDVAIDPEHAALVYHLVPGSKRGATEAASQTSVERLALRPGGDGWMFDHEQGSRTATELAAEIVKDKPNYNAGALLRPIVQDLALPVAAYVGGFGELAYHAQLGELRERSGLAPGVFVPRLTATVTDARLRTSLRHIQMSAGAFLRAPNLDERQVHQVDAAQVERLRAAYRAFKSELMLEHDALSAIDPGLGGQLRRVLSQAKKHVDALATRVERIETSLSGSDRRHRRRLLAQLWPRESPQERLLTSCQLTARLGRDWLDELLAEIDPLPLEHLIVHVDPHAPDPIKPA
jgi:bacillithiol synthase